MDCAQKLNFDNCDRYSAWNSTLVSVESCEMSDSFNSSSDCLSPPAGGAIARKLNFSDASDSPPEESAPVPFSPPYRKVRALR